MRSIVNLILFFPLFVFANDLTIRVRPYNLKNESSHITLADLVSENDLNNKQLELFKGIVLGDGPKLGEKRVFTNRAIAEAVRQNVTTREWNLQIPFRVVIENRGFELAQEAVEQDLITNWKKLCADCQITISNMQLPILPKNLTFSNWTIEYDGRLPRGSFTQRIRFHSEGNRPVYYWVSGQSLLKKKVPVLTRSLNQGVRAQKGDYNWEWRDVSFANDGIATDDDILTQNTKFVMNAGDIVWKNSLLREKAVRRGDIVRVTVGEDNWKISMQAVTEQDGFVGDKVNVRNSQTNKIIVGRVVGAGEVEVLE